MNIGQLTRAVHDNFAVAFDFGPSGVFDDVAVTGATVASSPSGLTVQTPATVATNVATFRVSGGTAGVTYEVAVTATNGTDTVCRSIAVVTLSC